MRYAVLCSENVIRNVTYWIEADSEYEARELAYQGETVGEEFHEDVAVIDRSVTEIEQVEEMKK